MQTITNVLAFICGLYILTVIVNWSDPKFFDYSIITIYGLCTMLVIVNLFILKQKKKYQ